MMKTILVALIGLVSLSVSASPVFEKDRGGGVVAYAEGASSVALSWNHKDSFVTITGPAAELLSNSLKVEAKEDLGNPFAKRGEVVKEKGLVKCTAIDSVVYECIIKIEN